MRRKLHFAGIFSTFDLQSAFFNLCVRLARYGTPNSTGRVILSRSSRNTSCNLCRTPARRADPETHLHEVSLYWMLGGCCSTVMLNSASVWLT